MVKVSVIVPIYNVENYLEESLSSVLSQTLEDIEIICVNDGSTDNSLNILNDFAQKDSRIKIFSQENLGVSVARNNALKKASGDYIYFFDADDYICPTGLEKLYISAVNNDSDISIFKAMVFNNDFSDAYESHMCVIDSLYPNCDFENQTFNHRDIKKFILNTPQMPWNKLFKKKFLDKYEDIEFPPNLPYNDVVFHVKSMLRAYKISFVPEYLYYYRKNNPNSISNDNSNHIQIFKIIKIVEDFLKEENFMEEYQKEFDCFKIDHISYHMRTPLSKEYYLLAREEFENVNVEENELLKSFDLDKYNTIMALSVDEIDTFEDKLNSLDFKKIKVSVIVPVYNVEKYLEECLNSLINQTLKDIEIICVNDGSTDNSADILESYAKKDDRLLVITQENQGLAAARNTGLNYVNGEYIYFIDSDDFLELNALEELYNIAVEKSLDFVLFPLINFDDEIGEYYHTSYYDMPTIADIVKDNVFSYVDLGDSMFKMAVSAVNKFYKAEFIDRIGSRFPVGLIFEDNVFFWEVLLNAERIYFVQKHYYIRRRHLDSITSKTNIKHADTLKIHNMIFEIFKKYGLFDKFKKKLFNQKVVSANMRFSNVNDDIKPIFFEKIKKDFEEMIGEYGFENILNHLLLRSKLIFRNVIKSKDSQEYILSLKYDELESNIKNISKKNRKLKKEIILINKQNDEMLNSKSWKITKPLRSFKKFVSGDKISFKEKILNKSNSYTYYKLGYKKLSKINKTLTVEKNELSNLNLQLKKQNKDLEKINDKLIHQFNSLNAKINDFHSDYKESQEFNAEKFEFFRDKINFINQDFISRDNFNKSLYKELQYAFVFDDTIKGSEWLDNQHFSLINSAANYSLAYSLYRILNDAKPKNILELGLGQTTKLTTQYVNHFNDSKLTVVEGDKEWIDLFTESLDINDNTQILNLDLESFTYQDDETIRFKGFLEALGDQKFDLIIIDGPQGFIMDSENNVIELNYSRTNVWQLIPQNLADDFIIIMDDFNRVGEQNTFEHIRELLNENNIEFYEYNSWAFKTQHALFTENYKYIGWI